MSHSSGGGFNRKDMRRQAKLVERQSLRDLSKNQIQKDFTLNKLRQARKILWESEAAEDARLRRDIAHFKVTGKCIEHRWAVFAGAQHAECLVCRERAI